MDWYLHELYAHYRYLEREQKSRSRPPARSRRRRINPFRKRLAWSFVRLGVRLDAEASLAAMRRVPST